MNYTATYSPEDNKLRLYASTRLPVDVYAKAKELGFIWAPRQELFVAPMWTPKREDFLVELCGEIGDEDTTLVERAEERADRFSEYKERRIEDAERAQAAVSSIADNIPLGQPILIGHHSERRARKDAERIQNGMRKTVQMWQTADYWQQRAKGALHHAKYKQLPGVRHRRIKGLEADLRRVRNSFTPCPKTAPQVWDGVEHVWITNGSRGGRWVKSESLPRLEAGSQRWIAHLENRIAYERAMLGEQGGIVSDRHEIEKGGKVLVYDEWVIVLRVNKGANGAVNSLKTAPLSFTRGESAFIKIERVKDYRAPEAGDVEKVKAATKLPPLCNYPGDGFAVCTQEQWKKISSDYKSQSHRIEATERTGAHRVRYALGVWLTLPEGKDSTERSNQRHRYYPVFITDAKRVDPPALTPDTPERPALTSERADVPSLDVNPDVEASRNIHAEIPKDTRIPSFGELEAMKKAAKQGVSVVVAPQLFPTPVDLAARMIELADIQPGQRVLEPSVGTGHLAEAVFNAAPVEIVAVEHNHSVGAAFRSRYQSWNNSRIHLVIGDFLEQDAETLGTFDRIVMNPPFQNGADIKHIEHARRFLKPGGTLVALCANGPRQQAQLAPMVEAHGGLWEELPADTFKEQGTSVRTVLLTFTSEDTAPEDNPETRLRTLWDAQGVPREKQESILADVAAKAMPGAQIGPFTLGGE